MRYFQIQYPDENDNNIVEVLSEEDIRRDYFPFWYEKMCAKFGKAHVDENYTFEDCLGDWKVVHWAIEVDAPT
jgi:hypothetical protein